MDKRDKLIKSLKVSLEVAEKEISKLKIAGVELRKEKLENKTKGKQIKLLLKLTNNQRRILNKARRDAMSVRKAVDEVKGSENKYRIKSFQDEIRFLKRRNRMLKENLTDAKEKDMELNVEFDWLEDEKLIERAERHRA